MRMFYQGGSPWGGWYIRNRLKMNACGCVVCTATHLNNLLRNQAMTPADILRVLRDAKEPYALVDGTGSGPGDLLAWPGACKALQLVCDEAVATGGDHDDALHEFATHQVDANADLAGVLAAAMVGGAAAVRVDVDGDGLGDHTISCVERVGDSFKCVCSALADYVVLDENLENRDVKWNGRPHPYRAVSVRAIRLAA